jgi:hypothetical protein
MSWAFIIGLFASAMALITVGECDLHYGRSIVGGGVSVLIGGLALLVSIVLAAAYSDRLIMRNSCSR